jgi:hypothetical protein
MKYLIWAAGLVAVATALSAAKTKRESVYTDMVNVGCVKNAEYEIRCNGAGEWYLDIGDEGNIITVGVGKAGLKGEPMVLTGRSLGDKAEWRGTRSRRGFNPDALIVRMRPVEDDEQNSSLLFIIKLNPNGACLHGLVDAKVNANANMLARSAADRLPAACEDYPQVYGKASGATSLYGT